MTINNIIKKLESITEAEGYHFNKPKTGVLEKLANAINLAGENPNYNEVMIAKNNEGYMSVNSETVYKQSCASSSEAYLVATYLEMTQNLQDKIDRKDNWLNPKPSTSTPSDFWITGYRNSVSNYLINSNYTPASLHLDSFGWEDHKLISKNHKNGSREEIVALFNLQSSEIAEFNGSYNFENDTKMFLIAEVVYASGKIGYIAQETDLQTVLKSIITV